MTKVITVNERGALTLPKEVREKLGVARGGQLVVEMDEDPTWQSFHTCSRFTCFQRILVKSV